MILGRVRCANNVFVMVIQSLLSYKNNKQFSLIFRLKLFNFEYSHFENIVFYALNQTEFQSQLLLLKMKKTFNYRNACI